MSRLLLMCVAACASIRTAPHRNPTREDTREDRYTIELDARLATTLERAGVVLEVPPANEPVAVRRVLDIAVRPIRRFRDGTSGSLVSFAGSDSFVTRGGVVHAYAPDCSHGRAVELRRFPDGEIVDVDAVDHIAGPELGGDTFDLIFPILSPAPPSLDEGAPAPRAITWPFRSDHGAWYHRVAAMWRHEGMEPLPAGGEAWKLTYEGEWSGKGSAAAEYGPTSGLATGRAAGEVRLRRPDGQVLSHAFAWERDVETTWALAPGGAIRVMQHQTFTGRLEFQGTSRPPPPPWGEAPPPEEGDLPLYLDDGGVRTRLQNRRSALDGCLTGSPALADAVAWIAVARSGRVEGVRLDPGTGDAGADACAQRVLAETAMPAHVGDTPVLVRAPLVARNGHFQVHPSIGVEERRVDPLFLYVAPDVDLHDLDALRALLGLPAPLHPSDREGF